MTPRVAVLVSSLLALALVGAAPARSDSDSNTPSVSRDTAAGAGSLLDLEARRLGAGVEKLDRYRGQVLLIVNTASRCGNTPQYEGLETLYERYREQGFTILGFPSNDFAGQEPGSDAQIADFCRANYGVEFPMFSKVKVKGPDAHPVYRYLTSLPEPIGGPVQWNFQKYLVDREGVVVVRYAPGVKPEAADLVAEIERLLVAK